MKNKMHSQYMFGIMDPSVIRGIGWVNDVLAFFDAVQLAVETPKRDYPFLWSLRYRPIFGAEMLLLFEEAQKLRSLMAEIAVTDDVLAKLNVDLTITKLNIEAENLAGLFVTMFKTLAEDAPEYVRACEDYPELNPLETGSVRIGPVEPLIPSRFFKKLPATAFDDADPPLWLREEIFDEEFYKGKI